MAEGVRFELTRALGLPVFKTGALNHSATLPRSVFEYTEFIGKSSTKPVLAARRDRVRASRECVACRVKTQRFPAAD